MSLTADLLRDTFQQLGITKHYRGYKQAILAIELSVEDESRLLRVVDQIYGVVAAKCGCSKGCVERNIRTISHVAWKTNPRRMKELAGYPLYASPTVSEFISIMTVFIQREMNKVSEPTAGIAKAAR